MILQPGQANTGSDMQHRGRPSGPSFANPKPRPHTQTPDPPIIDSVPPSYYHHSFTQTCSSKPCSCVCMVGEGQVVLLPVPQL